jgi:hypothetical protein
MLEIIVYFLLAAGAWTLIGYGSWWGTGKKKRRDRDSHGDDSSGVSG